MNKRDGGPIHPQVIKEYHVCQQCKGTGITQDSSATQCFYCGGRGTAEWVGEHPGLSLRDYFAAAALQGLIARGDELLTSDVPHYASMSYDMAEAMLKEKDIRPWPA